MCRAVWGLPQVGILPHGYFECPNTPGLWKHTTRPIAFTLVVDNFDIKYVRKEHTDHLIKCIKTKYELTKDWAGNLYCGIKLDWDYDARTLDMRYIKNCSENINVVSPQNCNIVLIPHPPNNTAQRHKLPFQSTYPQNYCRRKSRK
jgi:hypothetical protein